MNYQDLLPPSLISDIDDSYLSDDFTVEYYDPLDKETIYGLLKEFKRTGEAVDLNHARLYARGLFATVKPSWRLAMMGIIQHMIYCPLDAEGAITLNLDTDTYDINDTKLMGVLTNKVAFSISQQWMNHYLRFYWDVSINRKFTSELLHHLGAMGCFKLKTYRFGSFKSADGQKWKAPTEVTEYDLKLLLTIASEWQELWLACPENTFQDLPHHKGYLSKRIFDAALRLLNTKDNFDTTKNHFGSKQGFGSPFPNRKVTVTKEQKITRKARRKAAKEKDKPTKEKVRPVLSHLWDSLTMGYKSVFNWNSMNELERMGFKNTQRKKVIDIYGTKPITVSKGKQYSSEYCEPPGLDDYLVELPY